MPVDSLPPPEMISSTSSEEMQNGLHLSYESGEPSLDPKSKEVGPRETFYHLVNIDEHPEVLPLARALALEELDGVGDGARQLPVGLTPFDEDAASLDAVLDSLSDWSSRFVRPWHQPNEDLTRRQVFHWFLQYIPTALVDGCWLQCALGVSTAHTSIGGRFTGMYAHQVRAYLPDPGRHFVGDYRGVYERLGAPLEEVSSHSLVELENLLDAAFELPNFLLSIAQFPRSHLPELLGLNLSWQYLDLSAVGPTLIRDVCAAYALPLLGDDLGGPDFLDKGRELARSATLAFLDDHDASSRVRAWSRVWRGLATGASVWARWFDNVGAAAPQGAPDPRQEMIDLIRRKAPHAVGYHVDKALGDTRIDDRLRPDTFDGAALLDELARSPWIEPGDSDTSAFLKRLVEFGGPMLAVFSPVELEIIKRWIDTLPRDAGETGAASAEMELEPDPLVGPTSSHGSSTRNLPVWTVSDFRRRSQKRYGSCSVRDLYYHLVNVEFFPDVLPVAERYARDRLERSMAMIQRGVRPIPSRRYDPDALERWVYNKHREQIDSYRTPDARPDVAKGAFIEATVQLAPLILIDGGWLQRMASPPLIHTTVGRMLFHIFFEEVGEGDPEKHHANIYRDLLAAMGEDAPPVVTKEFAHWSRLKNSSFEVPALWLSISCFPRHFLPEILGLNLAVELAGIGGPYMEARDTLRQFGFPTLFVDVHNAADNVAYGHAAWAMNAIKRYLDEVAEREGPHNIDHTWHRVWTGVRSTLPQIGRLRMMAHRMGRRFFGAPDGGRVPLIFPS